MNAQIEDVLQDVLQQKEDLILEQMGKLLRDGVLLVEQTRPMLVQGHDSTRIELRQAVTLTYKAEEIVTALKKENAELRLELNLIREFLGTYGNKSKVSPTEMFHEEMFGLGGSRS